MNHVQLPTTAPRPTKAGEAFTTFAIMRRNNGCGWARRQQMSKRWLLLVQAAPSSFLRPDAITVTLQVGAGEICPVTNKWARPKPGACPGVIRLGEGFGYQYHI